MYHFLCNYYFICGYFRAKNIIFFLSTIRKHLFRRMRVFGDVRRGGFRVYAWYARVFRMYHIANLFGIGVVYLFRRLVAFPPFLICPFQFCFAYWYYWGVIPPSAIVGFFWSLSLYQLFVRTQRLIRPIPVFPSARVRRSKRVSPLEVRYRFRRGIRPRSQSPTAAAGSFDPTRGRSHAAYKAIWFIPYDQSCLRSFSSCHEVLLLLR